MRVPAAVGGFVFLFLVLFEPFEFGRLSPWRRVQFAGLNAGIAFVICWLAALVHSKLFPTGKDSRRQRWWDGALMMGALLVALAIGATAVSLASGWSTGASSLGSVVRTYGVIQFRVLLLGIFPIGFYLLFLQVSESQQRARQLEELNRQLLSARDPQGSNLPEPTSEISLGAEDGGRESVDFAPRDLLFVASANNYVEIVLRAREGVARKLLRNKLKAVEARLVEEGLVVFRCHRTHLVHLDAVESIRNTSSGYQLKLQGLEPPIPVSRRRSSELREALERLSRS